MNKQKPEAKYGNISVWPSKELSNGAKVQSVCFAQENGEKRYVSVFPKLKEYELSSDEVLELSLRNRVRIEGENERGPFVCTVVNRGIESKCVTKDGNTFQNHSMQLGLAYHKLTKDGQTFGFNCNGVGFYRTCEDTKNHKSMDIDPEDCFKLLEGKTVIKEGLIASLKRLPEKKESEEQEKYKTAYLSIEADPILVRLNQKWEKSITQSNELKHASVKDEILQI